MGLMIVPNHISDLINKRLEAAFIRCPEAAKDRAVLYMQLLAYYDEHGVVPEFTLAPMAGQAEGK